MKYLVSAIVIGVSLAACTPSTTSTTNQATQAPTPIEQAQSTEEENITMGSKQYSQAPGTLADEDIQQKAAVIETSKGTIRFTLFADEAPLAVSNFVFLANDGFYDGLIFHRREEGFVIQGGDPSGNGTGGPGYRFEDEAVTRSYTRGIVAMANAGPNTNGSQFFIMLADTPLPPNYTIFGEVTEGMDVVDQIRVGDQMTSVTIQDRE